MEKRLQAMYKDGVLQPLEALSLKEMRQVTVTITDSPVIDEDLAGYLRQKSGLLPGMTTLH